MNIQDIINNINKIKHDDNENNYSNNKNNFDNMNISDKNTTTTDDKNIINEENTDINILLSEINKYFDHTKDGIFGIDDFLITISYILYFIAFVLLIKSYWKANLGIDPNFQTLVQIFMAITIIMTVYSVYLQNITYADQAANEDTNFFDNFFKDFFDSTIEFFINNPSMNYYFNELFYNTSNYNEKDRNKDLETQYSLIIFSRMGAIVYYINTYKKKKYGEHSQQLKRTENKLLKILDSFYGSKIFVENWNMYKKGLANPGIIDYVKKNFDK